MKVSKISHRIILSLFVTLMFCLFVPQTVFCQAEKLGIVSYTPPKGWTKTPKENVVAFSEYNADTGKYCIITVYGATEWTGTAAGDFKREWSNLVVKQMTTEEKSPKTDTAESDGWTVVSGGSPVESSAGKGLAFLTVISGTGRTISILSVFNDPAYVKQVDTFISTIDLDKPAPPVNNTTATPGSAPASGAATFDEYGSLIIPQPSRQLTFADLAGVWTDGPNRMTTSYVYSGSGRSAGRDTSAYEVKTTFKADGTYSSYFHSVRKKYETESTTETGRYTIDGRLLSWRGISSYSPNTTKTTKYVIRGWLELPDMAILVVSGAFRDDQEIPANIFTNPEQGANLNERWVRVK